MRLSASLNILFVILLSLSLSCHSQHAHAEVAHLQRLSLVEPNSLERAHCIELVSAWEQDGYLFLQVRVSCS
jgi:hypothetical protein